MFLQIPRTTTMNAAAAVTAEDTTMVEPGVYLEKLSAFSRMLRLEGLSVSPRETADASQILIDLGMDDREQVKTALRTVYAKSREEQLAFDQVFDGFFISEEKMREQAKHHAEHDAQFRENLEALEAGLPNLLQHVSNIKDVFGLPCVVALNAFPNDTEAELNLVKEKCAELGVNVALSELFMSPTVH